MARISIDNGANYVTAGEAVQCADWETIVGMMDDETRETVHAEMTPCENEEFLRRYLELAESDLIIG